MRRLLTLNERELEFMKLVCTEWTYKEIADRMYLSPRTIDGYRDALFEKLKCQTRVGLAMYVVKNGIVSLNEEAHQGSYENLALRASNLMIALRATALWAVVPAAQMI